jgi:SAM-dependent methyltransferase
VIATDVVATPWAERVVDATALPFEDASVGNIVMVDVFHHLAAPQDFLREASRVLMSGGRVVMLEPWTSPLGYLFYKHVHHEDADRSVDPAAPFEDGKDPMDGNAALPELYFGTADRPCPQTRLRLVEVQKLPAISWLLSGGFQPVSLLPNALWPIAKALDSVAKPLARLVSLRALIVLER